jgi:hypothetical protein
VLLKGKLEDTDNLMSNSCTSIPYIDMTFMLIYLSPEAFMNSSRIDLILLEIMVDAPPRNRVSSTNCEWFILFARFIILMPRIVLLLRLPPMIYSRLLPSRCKAEGTMGNLVSILLIF